MDQNHFYKIFLVTFFLTAVLAQFGCATSQRPENSQSLTLIAGGDVVWTQRVRLPDYYFGSEDKNSLKSDDGWRRLPYIANNRNLEFLEQKYSREFSTDKAHYKTAIQYDLEFQSEQKRLEYPFVNIGPQLENADLTFINLETPLSNNGRLSGAFSMPESFANVLAENGVDVVSTANNHAFDAEGQGLTDTLRALRNAKICAVGTGENIREASSAKVIEIKGQKIAFLAFTYGVNPTRTSLGFATKDRSGAAPLDPGLIKQEIGNIRPSVDIVIVSLHWGLENTPDIHPAARTLGHDIIDAGADVILGHHPHIPRGVEVYRKGLIIYSLGNFIFGHNHDKWEDNFLAKLEFENGSVTGAILIPIAGRGQNITQPYIQTGHQGGLTLQLLKQRSQILGTEVKIKEGVGVVTLDN